MVERVRLFKGATELKYSALRWEKTSDHIIDSGQATIEANAVVTNHATLDFKKADGVTTIFTGQAIERRESTTWNLRIYTLGYELNNVRVEQVWTSVAPETIVQEVIDNYTTNLTYDTANSGTSGVIISKYLGKAYAIDIIQDMMDTLQWQLTIDINGNVKFSPRGNTDNGKTFTNGADIFISEWSSDETGIINHVKVVGGFQSFQTTETIVGTGTSFTLTKKPSGVLKAVVSGSEVSPSLYTVNAEDKTVVFDASKTDPVFTYEYLQPIVVEYQNDSSIATYGEIFKEIITPWLNAFTEVWRYAKSIVEDFGTPSVSAKGVIPGLDYSREVDEQITIVDAIRSKTTAKYTVFKVTYDAGANTTTLHLGSRDSEFFDWQRGVEDRIKKLERNTLETQETIFARSFPHNINVAIAVSSVWEYRNMQNSAISDHTTLGMSRATRDTEADCSGNLHAGTWQGTGIAGSQFTNNDGKRLGYGSFNGSDNYITTPDSTDLDLSGNDFSIALAVRVSSLPGAEKYLVQKYDGTDGWSVRITSANKVQLVYSNGGSDSTITTTATLTTNTWYHIVFTKESTALTSYVDGAADNTATGTGNAGTNTSAVEVGRYSVTYFTGDIDEVRLYNIALSSTEASDLNANLHVQTSNQILYFSMDDPISGDHSGSRITIT